MLILSLIANRVIILIGTHGTIICYLLPIIRSSYTEKYHDPTQDER